uniref:Cna B-type domain-containing protein n=1 Tax=uncultured Methanobrevibacter sp. TaxID=253161 RepID=UPI00262FF83A
DNNRDGIRPVSVVVELLANGTKIKEATLTANNNWFVSFTDLYVYAHNGSLINYTIREVPVEGYNTTITNSTAGNYTVTNSHIPVLTEVNVTKVWEDADDFDGIRPPSVVVELLDNGTKIDEATLSADNGWFASFTGLYVYTHNGTLINYTVREVPVAGYNVTITNDTAYNFTVTNNHTLYIRNMTVAKVTLDKVVFINDKVRFLIVVTNTGECNLTNVTVTEIFEDEDLNYEYFIDSTNRWKQTGDYVFAYEGTLGVGDNANFTVVFTALRNGTLLNSVNATSNQTENKSSNNTTVVNPICDLQIIKLVNLSRVYVNESVEWTIVVVNKGPSTAEDTVVRDILPKGLSIISADPSAGSFDEKTRIWEIGDLDIDTPVSLVLVTKVLASGNFTNVVTVNSTTPDSNMSNNKANNTTEAIPICDLEIIKLVSSKKSFVGEELTWTIRVTNHGPSPALNVKVFEDLPDSLEFIRYEATKGKFNKATNIWTIGKLNNGESVTLKIVTKVLRVGNITNPVEVSTTTPDSNKSNDKANNTTEAISICDLEIKKSSDKKEYSKGDRMHWIIEVVNHGPSPATGVVALDKLPAAVKYMSYTASKGSYDASTGKWNIGDLAIGESVRLDILCLILATGEITNNANVTCNENETDLDNNHDNATCIVKDIPNNETENVTNHTEHAPAHTQAALKETGNPVAYLLFALLAIFASCWSRKEQG